MKTTNPLDAARIELLLSELRLPAIKLMWAKFAEQADKEGWPAARFLAALAEHEIADRGRRRIERHLAEARLPVGKTLSSFDFEAVPMVSKAQVMALTAGDSWLQKGANLLLFGSRCRARILRMTSAEWTPSASASAQAASTAGSPSMSTAVRMSTIMRRRWPMPGAGRELQCRLVAGEGGGKCRTAPGGRRSGQAHLRRGLACGR